jgi:ferric iron reductase protein FhuF
METLASLPQTKYIHINELFQIDVLQTFLAECTSALSAPSAIISASQFSKRYSYYLLAPSLKQLLTSGQFASIQRNRDYIEIDYQTGEFQLVINENTLSYNTNHCSRQQIDRYINHYFADHLVPLWTSISNLTGIKMDLLWENAYIYISWMCLNHIEAPFVKENFIYLTQKADGSLFHLPSNPFSAFTSSSPIRNKCCLYFMLPSAAGSKCKTCPLVCKD